MPSTLKRLDNGNIELTITIPSDRVVKTWDEVVDEYVKNTTLPGFRKGKAPRKMVEGKLSADTIQEETLKKLLPQGYVEAVKEHNLNPILNPKIHVEKIEDPQALSESKSWQFTATTCEAPKISLGTYKKAIVDVTAKSKIVIPGKEQISPSLDEIIKALLGAVSIQIPKILVDTETDRLLAQTLDEVKRLGLTLDQYLASTGKSAQQLRDDYAKKAQDDLTLEFALGRIAEDEHIVVEQKEIDEAIQNEKKPQAVEAGINYTAEIVHAQRRIAHQENQEMKAQIDQIVFELKHLAKSSTILEAEFREVVVEQRIEKPGKYHVSFFEWMLSVVKSARMRVEDSGAWLALFKSKKKQRGYWQMFKKHGTSFGLSNERVVSTQTG